MSNGFQEYPKAMHGPDGAEAVVNSAEEEKALGDGWIDGHEHWAAVSASNDEEEAGSGGSMEGEVDLSTLNKAQLVAHGLDSHGLKLAPALNKAQCIAAIEAARTAAAELASGDAAQTQEEAVE